MLFRNDFIFWKKKKRAPSGLRSDSWIGGIIVPSVVGVWPQATVLVPEMPLPPDLLSLVLEGGMEEHWREGEACGQGPLVLTSAYPWPIDLVKMVSLQSFYKYVLSTYYMLSSF